MPAREDAYARHQRQRWLRPDAHRWVRSDAARFLVRNGTASVYSDVERKYSPNQPRVPAGNGRESGRWTDDSSGGSATLEAQPLPQWEISTSATLILRLLSKSD